VERRKKRELMHAEEEAGSTFSFKKLMIASKHLGKSIINTKEETHEEELAESQNLVYFELSSFVKYFVNF